MKTIAWLLIVVISFSTLPTWAQSALEEIVVSAQKRDESLQDVGIAITAFGAEDTKNLGLGDIEQLAIATPNLQSLDASAGLPSFRIRGIGLNEFQAAFDSPVGVHVDEVFLSKPAFASMGFFDVSRVEVLKGPQGTVFGRNTTGGAVNYYSNEPTDEFEGKISLSYARFNRIEAESYVSGPLTDRVSGRLAVQYLDQSNGPYDNLFDGQEIGEHKQYQARAQLHWENSVTEVIGEVHFGSRDGDLTPYDNLFQATPGALPPNPALAIRDPIGRYTLNQDYNPTTDSEAFGFRLRIDHDTSVGTFTSLTAFKSFERDNREDSDSTPIVSTNLDWYSDQDQFTQEFRLVGERVGWSYLFGAYYESDETETVDLLDGSDVLPAILGLFQAGTDFVTKADSYALFMSHEFLFSDTLTGILGLRYTKDDNSFDGQGFITLAQATPIGPEDRIAPADRTVIVDETLSRTDDDFNFKVGLNYDFSDDALLYGFVTTGYRAGGFDLFVTTPDVIQFVPEETTAYELGLKTTLAEGRINLNTAIFFTEVEDYQSNVNLAGELTPRRRNIGTLETQGLEVDFTWRPNDNWKFQFGGGYTDAEIASVATDATGAPFSVDGTSLVGNRPVNTPKLSFNSIIGYQQPVANTLRLELLSMASWSDERFLEIQNAPDHLVSSYATLDASIALVSDDDRWRVSVWGRNITDEDYLRYINDVPSFGFFLTINADPATYGISFDYSF